MALSGSQKAYLQARSAIARSGATRSNYYFPVFAVITIENNGVPVDVTAHVAYNGWSISMNINDELDTATLRLLPSLPFVPKTRSQVRIGFGTAANTQFAGIVMTTQQTRRPGPDPRFWYDLTCVDWLTVFDARLVLAEYPAQSVTTTILDLVQRFTAGGFTTEGVAPGLPSVGGFEAVNERPSTVVRRLTSLVGGGFYIDAARRLRAWSTAIPSPIQESTPQPLTDTLSTLKTFRMTEDASQQRTRVIVEGMRASTYLGVLAVPWPNKQDIPVDDASFIPVQDSAVLPAQPVNYVRIGTQYARVLNAFQPQADASKNPPGSTVSFAVPLGATQIDVVDTSLFPAAGWCQVAEQILLFTKVSATRLTLVPGALQAPIAVGTQVVVLPRFEADPQERANNPASPHIWLQRAAGAAHLDQTPVVLVSMRQDHTTAAAIATREKSDGFYEHLIQDGRFTSEGSKARAAAELANFAAPLVAYEWETEDLNAEPGRMQHIALTQGTPVTADVRITNVEVNPITSKDLPRRTVRATIVQPASVLDVWLDDSR